MSTTNGGPNPEKLPQLNVLTKYIKDFSFENPNAPRPLTPPQQQMSVLLAQQPPQPASRNRHCQQPEGRRRNPVATSAVRAIPGLLRFARNDDYLISTSVTSFTRLLASTGLPSRVTSMLRTMSPPPGIAQVWNFCVCGSNRTTVLG